jgi:molybdopterin-guanine dinucleotide biosynthesis protein A
MTSAMPGRATGRSSGDTRPSLPVRCPYASTRQWLFEVLTGIILAGGKSTRFGSDKASALLAGEPLLDWVAAAVAQVCGRVIVVRAAGQVLPAINANYEIAEDFVDARGPLAGLVTGMRAAGDGYAFASSCDVPLLRPAVIELLAARAAGRDGAIAVSGGFLQPLVAVYRVETCLPAFERSLAAGNAKLIAALDGLDLAQVDEAALRVADPELLSFRNVNEHRTLAGLETQVGGREER